MQLSGTFQMRQSSMKSKIKESLTQGDLVFSNIPPIFASYSLPHKLKKMYDQKIKVVEGFVWLLITDKAKEVYQSGLFDGSIYVLYDDDSEDACETYEDLLKALENGCDIGIEVGHVTERDARIILF